MSAMSSTSNSNNQSAGIPCHAGFSRWVISVAAATTIHAAAPWARAGPVGARRPASSVDTRMTRRASGAFRAERSPANNVATTPAHSPSTTTTPLRRARRVRHPPLRASARTSTRQVGRGVGIQRRSTRSTPALRMLRCPNANRSPTRLLIATRRLVSQTTPHRRPSSLRNSCKNWRSQGRVIEPHLLRIGSSPKASGAPRTLSLCVEARANCANARDWAAFEVRGRSLHERSRFRKAGVHSCAVALWSWRDLIPFYQVHLIGIPTRLAVHQREPATQVRRYPFAFSDHE